MSVEYRADRKKWGYRFYLHEKCYKRYAWDTKTEAKTAERKARTEAEANPPLPPTSFSSVSAAYLLASAEPEKGRSMWRLDGLRYTFKAHIIPFFGEATPIADITSGMVNDFIKALRKKNIKGKTIKNIITDLRAMFNWAIEEQFIITNPVNRADMDLIGSTKYIKPPLDPKVFDAAAEAIKNQSDRAWFDVTRFTGMRKDEANRLQWSDINWEAKKLHIPGTKTEEAEGWFPLAPIVINTLRKLYENGRDSNCLYIFPGQSSKTKGKKIYSRRRMFERIQQETAIKKYLEYNPQKSYDEALEECKKEKFRSGIKLTPKDLRDYFCNEVADKISDPNVLMRLMRHTNLNTTTKYLRTVEKRMEEAVQLLGN